MKNPKWFPCFMDTLMSHWHWFGRCDHVSTQVQKPQIPDDPWHIWVSPCLQEIAEPGPRDGEVVWSPFAFDFGDFTSAPGIQLCHSSIVSRNPDHPEPELLLDLLFNKRPIILHVFLEPAKSLQAIEVLHKDGSLHYKE